MEMIQGSAEWLHARCGRCTGSRVKDALDFMQNGLPSAKRKKYLRDCVAERLTGLATTHFVNDAMIWGSETEQFARAAYEVKTGNDVVLVGMAIHPEIPMFSASPDGYIGTDGILECKCPTTGTHIDWLRMVGVPKEHQPQCYAEMACSGRDWVDFVSYDPRLTRSAARHQLVVRRLERDDKRIAEMEAGVRQFLQEVDDLIGELDRRSPEPQQFREQLTQSLKMDPKHPHLLDASELFGELVP